MFDETDDFTVLHLAEKLRCKYPQLDKLPYKCININGLAMLLLNPYSNFLFLIWAYPLKQINYKLMDYKLIKWASINKPKISSI